MQFISLSEKYINIQENFFHMEKKFIIIYVLAWEMKDKTDFSFNKLRFFMQHEYVSIF